MVGTRRRVHRLLKPVLIGLGLTGALLGEAVPQVLQIVRSLFTPKATGFLLDLPANGRR